MYYFTEGLNFVLACPNMAEAALEAIATRVLVRMNKYYDHILINGGKDDLTYEMESLEQELNENPID